VCDEELSTISRLPLVAEGFHTATNDCPLCPNLDCCAGHMLSSESVSEGPEDAASQRDDVDDVSLARQRATSALCSLLSMNSAWEIQQASDTVNALMLSSEQSDALFSLASTDKAHSMAAHTAAACARTLIVDFIKAHKVLFGPFIDARDLARGRGGPMTECHVCNELLDIEKCQCLNCLNYVCLATSTHVIKGRQHNCCILLGYNTYYVDEDTIDWDLLQDIDPAEVYANMGVLCTTCLALRVDMKAMFAKYRTNLSLLTGKYEVLATLQETDCEDHHMQAQSNSSLFRDEEENVAAVVPAKLSPSECKFERYCALMSQPGKWADHVEVEASGKLFERPVVVRVNTCCTN